MPLFALVGSRGKKQCPQYIFFIVLVLLILLTSDEIKVKFKKVFRKVFSAVSDIFGSNYCKV
jgi:hypothetical protein